MPAQTLSNSSQAAKGHRKAGILSQRKYHVCDYSTTDHFRTQLTKVFICLSVIDWNIDYKEENNSDFWRGEVGRPGYPEFRGGGGGSISAQGLFFTVRGGMASATVMKNL